MTLSGEARSRLRPLNLDRAFTLPVWVLVVAFALFFALPFAGLVQQAVSQPQTWSVIRGTVVRDALVLSLWTATLATLIALILGTPVAYLLSRATFPGKAVVDALIDLPIVLPPTAAGVALLTAFGRRGLFGEPLAQWTGITLGFTTIAVIMAQLLVAGPFYVRAARTGFDRSDQQMERIAHTLGASRTRTLARVVIPQASGGILSGIVLCWARAMGELGATLIFAGNLQGRTQTMPLAIIQALEGTTQGLAGAIALSLILVAVAVCVLVVFRVITARLTGAG